jgi:predicted GNAT family N-acyltransferase
MNYKYYDYLPEEARKIREDVFILEQGFVDEFDENEEIATHMVLFENELPISTCRFYYDKEKEAYILGRIAVIKEYRGKKIGDQMLSFAEERIIEDGGEKILISAQVRVVEFYRKQGYLEFGEEYLDEGCPHIWMEKEVI